MAAVAQGVEARSPLRSRVADSIPRPDRWRAAKFPYCDRRGTSGRDSPNLCGISRRIWLQSNRPPEEWKRAQDESLRIIPDEVWFAATDQIKSRSNARDRGSKGARKDRWALSGLLKCGKCGGAIYALRHDRFGCSVNRDRGRAMCDVGTSWDADEVEGRAFEAMLEQATGEGLVDVIAARAARLVAEIARPADDTPRQELAKLDGQNCQPHRTRARRRRRGAAQAEATGTQVPPRETQTRPRDFRRQSFGPRNPQSRRGEDALAPRDSQQFARERLSGNRIPARRRKTRGLRRSGARVPR